MIDIKQADDRIDVMAEKQAPAAPAGTTRRLQHSLDFARYVFPPTPLTCSVSKCARWYGRFSNLLAATLRILIGAWRIRASVPRSSDMLL